MRSGISSSNRFRWPEAGHPAHTGVARPEDLRQGGNAGPEYQQSRPSTGKTLQVKTVSGRDASNIAAKVQALVLQLQTSKVVTLY